VKEVTHARELISKGAILVDVRSAAEFHTGALPGAVNIPLQTLGQIKDKMPIDSNIVVYCVSGARSHNAKTYLQQSGFQSVYDLGSYKNFQYS